MIQIRFSHSVFPRHFRVGNPPRKQNLPVRRPRWQIRPATAQQTGTSPLLVVAEVKKNGALADRTFYFVNYEAVKGSLFKLPRTTLALRSENGRARVTNAGSLPAVGVAVLQPGHLDTFTADANYFWLDPGESREIGVNSTAGLAVEAFNVDEAAITPTNPAGRASSGRLRSPASGR